jgi:hypothetical protein
MHIKHDFLAKDARSKVVLRERERAREQKAKEGRPESPREANPDTTSEERVFGVCLLTTSGSQSDTRIREPSKGQLIFMMEFGKNWQFNMRFFNLKF